MDQESGALFEKGTIGWYVFFFIPSLYRCFSVCTLGSPAPAGNTVDWLTRFFAACDARQDCVRPTFITMHAYVSTVQALKDYVVSRLTLLRNLAFVANPTAVTIYAKRSSITDIRPSRVWSSDLAH